MFDKHTILASAVILFMIVSLVGSAAAGSGNNNSEEKDLKVIVGFKGEPNPGLIRKHGGAVEREFSIISAVSATMPDQAVDGLRKAPAVDYVELDYKVIALEDNLPWGIDRIDADQVWNISDDSTYDGSGVKVAVLDTGIDYDHPDLASNCGDENLGENRYGYDFVNDDNDPMDDHGHGTWTSGIAAAANNDIGVIGANPDASLYGAKVLDSGGSGYVSDVVAGIEWSVKHGMNVISMSLGSDSDSQSLHDACDNAYNSGLLLVAAAGNDGNPGGNNDCVDYPARYGSVIAVAATDKDNERPRWSSTGPDVELAAPGVDIHSTWWDNTYETHSGTSASCPHVSGTAALVWSAYPDKSNSWIRGRLDNSAVDLGPEGRDSWYGYGLVDADRAAAEPNNPPTADPGGPYEGTEDEPISFNAENSSDPDGDSLTYKWDFGDGTTATTENELIEHTYDTGSEGSDETYVVILTVNDGTDDSEPENTTATVTGVNDEPIADADGPYSGVKNETITFDASGSSDEEGIENYTWDFGDGTTATTENELIEHTYENADNYTVVLTVTDTDGATDNDTTTAEVTETATTGATMHVESIQLSVQKKGPQYEARATVKILDENNNVVKEATVTGNFYLNENIISENVSGTTNGQGEAKLDSGKFDASIGDNVKFEVTDVYHPDYTYDSSSNMGTSETTTI